MNNGNAPDALSYLVVVSSQLEKLLVEVQQQSRESQAALQAARQKEEVLFRQAMAIMLHEQQQRLEVAVRPKVASAWIMLGIAAVIVVLLGVGGVLLSMHYMQVIKENQVTAELLKAYNRADVTLCNGQLCANIDAKAKRWGEQGQYAPVKSR